MQTVRPSVQIIVNADGVFKVRLCGRSWDDENGASEIYQKIKHLVHAIDQAMKESGAIEVQ